MEQLSSLLCCSKEVNINVDVTTLIDQFSFTELAVPVASPLAQNSCASQQRSVGYYLYYEVSTVSVSCKLVKE